MRNRHAREHVTTTARYASRSCCCRDRAALPKTECTVCRYRCRLRSHHLVQERPQVRAPRPLEAKGPGPPLRWHFLLPTLASPDQTILPDEACGRCRCRKPRRAQDNTDRNPSRRAQDEPDVGGVLPWSCELSTEEQPDECGAQRPAKHGRATPCWCAFIRQIGAHFQTYASTARDRRIQADSRRAAVHETHARGAASTASPVHPWSLCR